MSIIIVYLPLNNSFRYSDGLPAKGVPQVRLTDKEFTYSDKEKRLFACIFRKLLLSLHIESQGKTVSGLSRETTYLLTT